MISLPKFLKKLPFFKTEKDKIILGTRNFTFLVEIEGRNLRFSVEFDCKLEKYRRLKKGKEEFELNPFSIFKGHWWKMTARPTNFRLNYEELRPQRVPGSIILFFPFGDQKLHLCLEDKFELIEEFSEEFFNFVGGDYLSLEKEMFYRMREVVQNRIEQSLKDALRRVNDGECEN